MLHLAIVGTGQRADAIAAAIASGSGLAAAPPASADGLIIAGDNTAASLALLRDALPLGKPTLCTALPATLADLDALTALAARHGASLSLANELRYVPAIVAVRDTLARGEAGPLLSAFLSWHIHATADPLTVLGPAALDLLNCLLPAPIEHIQATAAPLFNPSQDAALLLLRDDTGLVRTVELLTGLPPALGSDDALLLEVFGETAALRAEPFNQAITIASATAHRRQDWSTPAPAPLLAAFAAALRTGHPLPHLPDDLRPALALLERVASGLDYGQSAPSP